MTNEQLACLLGHILMRIRGAKSFLADPVDVEGCRAVLLSLINDLDQQEGRLVGEMRMPDEK